MELSNHFDFGYIIAVICLTYIIIKVIDYINGNRIIPKLGKRIVLLISIAIITILYIICGYTDKHILVNSAIAAPIVWSWLLKPLCSKFGIDYKKINDVLY